MLCWSIWINCNNVVWNGYSKSPAEIVRISKLKLQEWTNANERNLEVAGGNGRLRELRNGRASAEVEVDELIINSDAACFSSPVVRDWVGLHGDGNDRVVAVCINKIDCCLEPKLAEIWWIREILSWLKELKESDSRIMANVLQERRLRLILHTQITSNYLPLSHLT